MFIRSERNTSGNMFPIVIAPIQKWVLYRPRTIIDTTVLRVMSLISVARIVFPEKIPPEVFDPDLNQLEEIKTYKGHLDRMPDNHRQLHWAQAKVYAWLMCLERELESIKVALALISTMKRKVSRSCRKG